MIAPRISGVPIFVTPCIMPDGSIAYRIEGRGYRLYASTRGVLLERGKQPVPIDVMTVARAMDEWMALDESSFRNANADKIRNLLVMR